MFIMIAIITFIHVEYEGIMRNFCAKCVGNDGNIEGA